MRRLPKSRFSRAHVTREELTSIWWGRHVRGGAWWCVDPIDHRPRNVTPSHTALHWPLAPERRGGSASAATGALHADNGEGASCCCAGDKTASAHAGSARLRRRRRRSGSRLRQPLTHGLLPLTEQLTEPDQRHRARRARRLFIGHGRVEPNLAAATGGVPRLHHPRRLHARRTESLGWLRDSRCVSSRQERVQCAHDLSHQGKGGTNLPPFNPTQPLPPFLARLLIVLLIRRCKQ
jgi:hypothetical protein